MKMHPDDIRQRNIEWVRAKEPRLPEFYSLDCFVDMRGKRYDYRWPVDPYGRTSEATAEHPLRVWAKSETTASAVHIARLRLVLSWPDAGEDVSKFVFDLERALDKALGIGVKAPAVSNSPRGDSENTHDEFDPILIAQRQKEAVTELSRHGYACRAAVAKGTTRWQKPW